MCGRDDEMRVLRTAFARASAGRGGLAFITGEPGIGKSRLVRELAGHARGAGAIAVTGRAVPGGSGIPYRPFTEALLQILRDRPMPSDGDVRAWLPVLQAILPGTGPSRAGGRLEDAVASPVARAEGVIRLIRRLGPEAGLLIALEDLHWADPDTLAVLEYLADNVGGERVLFVATSRDEPHSDGARLARRLADRRAVMRLSLGRLGAGDVERMVRACLAGAGDDLVARAQLAADGVPFLVEEVLASPGVPDSFAEMVRARLAGFSTGERRVLEAAALLGRSFDWQLLAAASGAGPAVVSASLERAVMSQLLTAGGEVFRFRHALTREAVAAGLLPPARQSLARSALTAVEAAHPGLDGVWRDIAADLAVQSGDTGRAGVLLARSGEEALERGALATAAGTLRRAVAMIADPAARVAAEGLLLGCLALAGQADEALRLGERLIESGAVASAAGPSLADIHLQMARAAIEATRWTAASAHLEAAKQLEAADPRPGRGPRLAVLTAELALARDEVRQAGRLADAVLDAADAGPEVRCHALEVTGRIRRMRDLGAARAAFEQALGIAEAEDLPVWRLRALHELGTIDLFDSGATDRLSQARRTAAELGVFSTAAVLDLQLAAAYDFRVELEESARHARLALSAAERLDMTDIQAKALLFLAEAHAMRQRPAEMEDCLRRASALAPADRFIEALGWGGCRGMSALFRRDLPGAIDAFGRAGALLRTLPHAEPAMFRALWPVALAATADARAAAVLAETRRGTVPLARVNRGALGYAEAMLAGRAGDRGRAIRLAAAADSELGEATLGHLSRLLAAGPAVTDGWGDPVRWLQSARADFAAKDFGGLADWCQELLSAPAGRLARIGITAREAEILALVAAGLANKEIAARLQLSHRTVEKHVESLLRKTCATSRTMLVALTGPWPQVSPGTT
jgi:DNA-binding CsgD family transcriptional regulator/tetratricopeptide (TPR) repeat protein